MLLVAGPFLGAETDNPLSDTTNLDILTDVRSLPGGSRLLALLLLAKLATLASADRTLLELLVASGDDIDNFLASRLELLSTLVVVSEIEDRAVGITSAVAGKLIASGSVFGGLGKKGL